MDLKPIFSKDNCNSKTAYLNWGFESKDDIRNFLTTADGYMKAALLLCINCLNDNSDSKADLLIFPILHGVNHSIELYFKACIFIIDRVESNSNAPKLNHDLNGLFKMLKEKIGNKENQTIDEAFEKVDTLVAPWIEEIEEKAGKNKRKELQMDFSRYPKTTTDKEQFYIAPNESNIEIDLVNFLDRFIKVYNSLKNLTDILFWQLLHTER